ncbi:carbonic anhydrase [Roseofilum casamattae]|uniref:Carbonic anhydrase n=1 Tax=Roseofilum casamattae BLCC-M143 TaxID=3022442 RepID=A0ABT7BRB6_9CYAN|nr:carbonic anhydrase [Roseofilum casamattae]MDJ1181742.1 carbonic anhydrase [Roseofilum casamattae BLCC-M143]
MKKLIRGLDEFRKTYVPDRQDLLEQLSHGQKPRVLFITCSDSRIAPNLITSTDIGELFIIRNAGNIVPPFGAANGGEGGTIEYAITALGIEQVIICGHSHCGAMKGLLKLNKLQADMPLVYDWLKHAESTRRLVLDNYPHQSGEELIETLVAENVLIQIENLKTYPMVRAKIHQGKLKIYGWIYEIETGEVLAYDAETHTYLPPQSQLLDEDSLTLRTCDPNSQMSSEKLNNIRAKLNALLSVTPHSAGAAQLAIRSLQELFEDASKSGMANGELRDYHFRFAEPVQVWARKVTEPVY